MKSSGIGGQAVLEGVMMKYKSDYAVATRKPDGGINVIHGKCKSISERSVFFRLPVIRGVINFIESLVLGMKTLTYSADFIVFRLIIFNIKHFSCSFIYIDDFFIRSNRNNSFFKGFQYVISCTEHCTESTWLITE